MTDMDLLNSILDRENTREATPVEGEFAITGTLPTLQDVIDFKEGTAAFDFGYYRFVEHPYLRELNRELTQQFRLRNSLLYTSPRIALLELCRYVFAQNPEVHFRIFAHNSSFPEIHFNKFFPPAFQPETDPISEKSELEDHDILLVSTLSIRANHQSAQNLMAVARSRDIPVLLYVNHSLEGPLPVDLTDYLLLSLRDNHSGTAGGAILSDRDRQMMDLRQQQKRRGPILSGRDAAVFLEQKPSTDHSDIIGKLESRLSALEEAKHCFLFPSGMNAIATILDLLRSPGKSELISIGHLYTDTYNMLRDPLDPLNAISNTNIGVDRIEDLPGLISEKTAAVITESITNPLNDVPDLQYIGQLTRQREIPFIVDNTIATPVNCRPFQYHADYVVHSTTKALNGKNDHGGGAVLVNSFSRAEEIKRQQESWQNTMSSPEARVLFRNLDDLESRVKQCNQNSGKVALFLEEHPEVDKVFYSGLPSHHSHQTASRLLSGFGSVVSFTLTQDNMAGLRTFYDSPMEAILKAPTLGSDRTLVCPYTLIAHYFEPEERLRELGLSRYLIRIAVGCEENIQPVLDDLSRALSL